MAAGRGVDLFLPPERDVQGLVLGHPLAVQAANLYYATMHFAVVFAFLIWMFVRHREAYRPVRSVLAIATLICLLIQLVPFAPPRMFPGFVDTAALYGQSVYGGGFDGDQFSAMPSVHVAWAVLVAFYVWRIGSGGWRYLGIAHAGTTVLVVVATANHWWLDGIVGALVVVASAWIVVGVRSAWRVIRGAADTGPPLVPEADTRGPLVAADPVTRGERSPRGPSRREPARRLGQSPQARAPCPLVTVRPSVPWLAEFPSPTAGTPATARTR